MIGLISLLKEVQGKPKAIFMAGPAGSGKSFISKQIIPSNFVNLNVDDTYEELLKASGLGMNLKDFGPEELSQAAKMMGQAQKITREKYSELTKNLQNLVIDGTGAASRPLLKKKQELEDLGYDTFMVMIYVSPITSLERNKQRDRSLLPSIVLRTWRDVNKNIDLYKQIFGDDMVIINNNPEDSIENFDMDYIKKTYLDTAKAKGKEKSPEEMAKSKEEKEQINKDIEDIIQNIPSFDTIDQAKSKITNFIKK
jgi:predicted kinase